MLCVRMYAVCLSHLCIVSVREYEVQDTFPLHFHHWESDCSLTRNKLTGADKGNLTV